MAQDQGQELLPVPPKEITPPKPPPQVEAPKEAKLPPPEKREVPPAKIKAAQKATVALQKEYRKLVRKSVSQPKDWAQKTAPRLREIIEEMERRGVDVTALSQEARKGLPPEQLRRGPGTMAAEPPPPRTSWIYLEGDPEISEALRRRIELIERTSEVMQSAEWFEGQYHEINEMVARGEVPAEEAQRYLERIATAAREKAEVLRRGRGESIGEILDLSEEEFRRRVRAFAPEETIPRAILLKIATDERLSEEFLNRFLEGPEYSPDEPYQLDLYQTINLNAFLRAVREVDMENRKGLERHTRFTAEKEMRLRFHEMARSASSATLETFAGIAHELKIRHFDAALNCVGVGAVMRLYERACQRTLVEKKRILAPELLGIERWVEQEFEHLCQEGIIKNRYGENLSDWEKRLALTVGRKFLVVTLRIPEYVAMGEIPEENVEGQDLFMGVPYESIVRTLNAGQWFWERLMVGGGRMGGEPGGKIPFGPGGKLRELSLSGKQLEAIERAKILAQLGGIDLRKLAGSSILQASGFWSGWREKVTITDFVRSDQALGMRLDRFREEKHREERIKLWKETADRVPLRIAYLLYDDVGEILRRHPQVPWEELERDLIFIEERRVQSGKETPDLSGLSPEKLAVIGEIQKKGKDRAENLADGYFPFSPFLDDVPWEQTVEEKIKGMSITDEEKKRQLAEQREELGTRVIQMVHLGGDEVPFRRINDFSDFWRARNALTAIFADSRVFENCLNHLKEARDALSSPLGLPGALRTLYPLEKGLIHFYEKNPFFRWVPLSNIAERLGYPTSWAQRFYGKYAASWNEWDKDNGLERLIFEGLIARNDEEGKDIGHLRSEVGLGFLKIKKWLAYIRHALPIIMAILFYEFSKRVIKPEGR